MSTVLAVLAALSFSIAGYFTKLSQGLTVLGPTAMMFGLFALGSALQALAMRHESMALTYAFVLGLEAVTAFFLSVWLLGESASAIRFGGIALVVAGIVLLKAGPR
jgi:quaternary ammonium compound-resistance protein SugE